jgi:hypothetical protein
MHQPGTGAATHAAIPATKAAATHVDRAQIIKVLRSRGLHDRADWASRELPQLVDTHRNSSLLRMLQIDPIAMERAGSEPARQA